MNIFLQAAALVSDPPGSLVYHLVLLFALGAAAAVALGQWQFVAPQAGARTPEPARLTLAAGLMFTLRLAATVLAFLAALGILNPLVAVPPFERAVSTLIILSIIWLLTFPEPLRLADASFSLLALLVGLALIISWGTWAGLAAAARFYNGTPQETAWEAAQILVLAAGAVLVAIRRRADWGLGLAILALLLAGHVIHYLVTIAQSNVSGIERLFEIVVVPLLAAVIFRRALRSKPTIPAPAHEPANENDAEPAEMPTVLVLAPVQDSPALPALDLQSVLASASQGTTVDIPTLEQSITAGVAQALHAPLVVLLKPAPDSATLKPAPNEVPLRPAPDSATLKAAPNGASQKPALDSAPPKPGPDAVPLEPALDGTQFEVTCAYELAQRKYVSVLCTVLDNHPDLVEALERNESVVWQPGESEADRRATIFAAGPEMIGPVLLVPLRSSEGRLLAVVGALQTARQIVWSAEQQAWLRDMAEPISVAWRAVAGRPAAEPKPAEVEPISVAWRAVATRAAAEPKLTSVEAERDSARQEAEQLRRQGQAQAEQLQRLEQAEAVHAEQLGEMETLRAHLQALAPEMDQLRQRQQELETLVEQQRLQEAELRSQLEHLSAAPADAVPAAIAPQPTPEAEALQATLQMLQPELEYYRGQEEQLQAEVEKLRAELAARPPGKSDTAAGRSDAAIGQSDTAAGRSDTPTPTPAPETETLRSNLQVLAAEIDTYRTEKQLQQSEIDRLRQETTRLQGDLDQARAQTGPAEELEHWRASAQALEAQVAESQSSQQKLQVELEQSRRQTAQLQAELEQRRELEQQRVLEQQRQLEQQRPAPVSAADGSAAETAPASASPFIDPEHGLAEMLEALAGAEARLTRQAEEIAGLHQSLAESLRQRPAPPPARPLQAADMEVIASLTQELRQPMSSIVGYVDLLLSESVGIIGALQRKFLERIKASSERIGVLLDDLMRVMDIDSGHLKLAQESVNVVQVIDDALRGCESQFREKGLRLASDIQPNLPPVQADRDALLQIFSHLINNSGAASANDTEVHLSVRHEIEQRPGADPLNYLIISVTDTGGGIAPADQPRVFSRLYRADAPLIAGLGDNGMGLSIAKALVEGHGGRIWVITDPGTGSTFYVLLPLEGKYAKSNGARAAAR